MTTDTAAWRTFHGAEYADVRAIPCITIANGHLIDEAGEALAEDHPALAAEIERRGAAYRDHGYGVRVPGVSQLVPTIGCDHS